MPRQFSNWVVDHPILIVIMSVVITVAALFGMPPKINSDFEVYFGPTNTNLKTYHKMQDEYATTDNVFFLIAPNDQVVFSNSTLAIVKEFTEEAWQLPFATRVDSITNFQHTEASEDELIVDDLIPEPTTATQAQLEKAKRIALGEPEILNRLLPAAAHVTGINVSFTFPGLDRKKELPQTVNGARALIEKYESKYDSIRIYVTGKVINNNAFKEASLYDLSHIVPLAFLIAFSFIAIYMYIATHRLLAALLATFSTLIIVIASIATAMGIASWLDVEISPPVANAPTMILTLAIADCIHVLVTYFQQMRTGLSRKNAMIESLRVNQQPIFLTSITTMVGFLSLNYSDSPPFQDLGNVVAIGVFIAWGFAVTLLPAITILLPIRVRVQKDEGFNSSFLGDKVVRYRHSLFFTLLISIVISIFFIPFNKLNDVWAEYFDERMEVRQNSDFVRENLTSPNTIEFSIGAGEEGGVADPQYLRTLDVFTDWLADQPEVTHVSTFTNVMKRINKSMHADAPSWYRLPNDRELASQYLLLYELSLPFGLDLTNQLTITKDSSRVVAVIRDSSTETVLTLQKRAQKWLRINAPAVMYHPGTGVDVMFGHIGYSNVRSMLQGTFGALVIISIVLGFALRSLKFGLISLIPNITPAAVAFGIWAIIDGEIGLGLSVVAGMTLGIVVDYTVHFLSKYLRAQRELGLNEPDAVRYAFTTVGTALIVTTLILTANFGVLAFSDFALNGDMGLLTAITIVIALVIDFFFLPPLLLLIKSKPQTQ